jgi:hypothetical protein
MVLFYQEKELDNNLNPNTIKLVFVTSRSFFNIKILFAVKEGKQKYCETVYSRIGINRMWILKNSKDLLDNFKSRSFSQGTPAY